MKRQKISGATYLLLIFISLSYPVAAANISALSCTSTDVQNAINQAGNGDTVTVPGGSCTWSPRVTIPSTKGITLDGGGNTAIAGTAALAVAASASTTTRVTGFSFTGIGDPNNGDVSFSGSTASAAFRLDHNTFSSGGTAIFVTVWNNAPGLIDHNSLTGGAASEMIHNMGMGATLLVGWLDDVTPGSASMLFIEDNTFTYPASGNPAYGYGTTAIQSYYGARTVFRYNTLNMTQVDQHGTPGNIGARWWEIYNNTFNVVPNGNLDKYMGLRAGSGVIFNNVKTGSPNGGAGGIVLYEEDTGIWPLAYQVGSGINGNIDGHLACGTRNNSPAYLWNNQAPDLNASGGSANVQANRDFFAAATQPATMFRGELLTDTCSTTYNYAPYTYPHPLQAGGTTSRPVQPTGLTAVVQ